MDALNSEGVEANRRQYLKVDLVTLDTKHEALKKELKQLGIEKEHFHNSIMEIDDNLANKQNNISRLRK